MPKAAQLPSIHPTVKARFRIGPHLSRVKPPGKVLGACIIASDWPCPFVMPRAMVSPSGHKSDLHRECKASPGHGICYARAILLAEGLKAPLLHDLRQQHEGEGMQIIAMVVKRSTHAKR